MPPVGKDMTGQRFGRLVALSVVPESVGKRVPWVWKCICDCGNICEVRGAHLRRGRTNSCGCLQAECRRTHGISALSNRFYKIYHSMISRCTNPEDGNYHKYGGAGIEVCNEWFDIAVFTEDMFQSYCDAECQYTPTLDRLDVSRGYSKHNCQWVPHAAQAQRRGRFKTNTSGVKGVKREDNGKGNIYWAANWHDHEGKPKSKRFSVSRLGEDGAFKAACDYRFDMIVELNEIHGANYDLSYEGACSEFQHETVDEQS